MAAGGDEVAEGGVNDYVHVLPGALGHGQIKFNRGITFTSFLWEWIHWGMHDTSVMRLPIVIISYDVSGLPARIWPILDAYPVKWTGGNLSADGNQATIEELVIAFGGRRSDSSGGGGEGGDEGGDKDKDEDEANSGVLAGSHQQRELAQKVVKLLKDTLRQERERDGRLGGN